MGGFDQKEVPNFDVIQEDPITEVVTREVWGPEAERLYMGFRFDGANTDHSLMLTMIDMVLSNSSKRINRFKLKSITEDNRRRLFSIGNERLLYSWILW